MSRAFWLVLCLVLLTSPARAQLSPGNSCSTSGQVSLSNKSPAYLLACNGSTWALGEAISTSGLVGFGTSTPLSAVSVSGGVAIGTTYAGTNAAGSNNLIVQGTVGIGTTSPNTALDVEVTGSGGSVVKIDNLQASGYSELDMFDASGGPQAFIGWGNASSAAPYTNAYYLGTNNAYPLLFQTASTTRMMITSSGNVGIGTTVPNTNLDLGAGFMEWGGQSRVSSTFSATSNTTLAPITGLSVTLTSGKTYAFDSILYATTSSGGMQVDLNGGTATATAVIGDAIAMTGTYIETQTRYSALNTALCAGNFSGTTNCHITGTITVNAGGTFIPRFAQNSSNATASTVAAGSIMIVQQLK
jgi:hypothetical protein